jgi:hypothetical protein
MSQLTVDISRKYKVDNRMVIVEQPVDAAATIFAGSGVGLNAATNFARQLVAGDVFLGFADGQAPNVANPSYPGLTINGAALGAAGAMNVGLRAAGVLVVPASTVGAGTAVNDVQTLALAGTLTAGSYELIFVDSTGVERVTAPIAFNANLAAIQTALDAVSGGANQIVAGGTAQTATTLTFSGALYAGKPQPLVTVNDAALTGVTTASVTHTTVGEPGTAVPGAAVYMSDGNTLTLAAAGNSRIGTIQSTYNSNVEIYFASPVVKV